MIRSVFYHYRPFTNTIKKTMTTPPKALLFVTSQCPHCPSVMQSLSELVKSGELSQLEIINLQFASQQAEKLNIKSVPWLKLGKFELTGLRDKQDLRQWIKRLDHEEATADYFIELMLSGELNKVEQLVKQHTEMFPALISLISLQGKHLSARIGAGAIIEALSGSDLLKNNLPLLAELTHHKEAGVRNDACYYLGLTQDERAIPHIEALLNDHDHDVKETAAEMLEELNTQPQT